MQLHQLKPTYRKKRRKRVGRGGKRGTYSGRGVKGQKSRSGSSLKPAIRSILKRYPKLRGYKFNPRALKPDIINVEDLEKKFKAGETVNPQILLQYKLIRKIKGKIPRVKILGRGKLSKALTIEGCQLSKGAKDQIKKVHGLVK